MLDDFGRSYPPTKHLIREKIDLNIALFSLHFIISKYEHEFTYQEINQPRISKAGYVIRIVKFLPFELPFLCCIGAG